MIKNEKVIIVSDVSWDGHQVGEHRLTRHLAEGNRVLYVERPISFMTFFVTYEKGAGPKQLKRWLAGGLRKEGRVLIASPPPVLPLRFTGWINRINQAILRRFLGRLIRKLDMSDAVVITYEPDSAGLHRHLQEKLFVYYCNDDQDAKGNWWNRPSHVLRRERELLETSDIVLSLTEGFATARRPYNRNLHVVPNGVDEGFIEASRSGRHVRPLDIEDVRRPVVGFFGIIDRRLDVELLLYVARTHPEWSLVLVGLAVERMGKEFDVLCALPNVHFLGAREKETIPAYIGAMDVCLIPSILLPKTRNVLSVKLFEYTALGKPIVATDLAELRPYAAFVKTSRDQEEFVQNIASWLGEWNGERRERAIQFASANTWRRRAEVVSEIIRVEVARRGERR